MPKIELDTDRDDEELQLIVREMETHALLELHDLLGRLGFMVEDELQWRALNEEKLESTDQPEKIKNQIENYGISRGSIND